MDARTRELKRELAQAELAWLDSGLDEAKGRELEAVLARCNEVLGLAKTNKLLDRVITERVYGIKGIKTAREEE